MAWISTKSSRDLFSCFKKILIHALTQMIFRHVWHVTWQFKHNDITARIRKQPTGPEKYYTCYALSVHWAVIKVDSKEAQKRHVDSIPQLTDVCLTLVAKTLSSKKQPVTVTNLGQLHVCSDGRWVGAIEKRQASNKNSVFQLLWNWKKHLPSRKPHLSYDDPSWVYSSWLSCLRFWTRADS